MARVASLCSPASRHRAGVCAGRAGKQPPYQTLNGTEKKAIYIAVAVAMFLAMMDQNVVIVSLPVIVRDLGQADLLTWVLSSYMLTSSAVMAL